MRTALTPREVRELLARATGGTPLLIWDGEMFFLVTPEVLAEALKTRGTAHDRGTVR